MSEKKGRRSMYDIPAVLWGVRILNVLFLLLSLWLFLGSRYGNQAPLYWYVTPLVYLATIITTVMHLFGHFTHRYHGKGQGEKRQAMRVMTLVLSGIVIVLMIIPYYALGIVMNRATSYAFLDMENGQRIAIVSNTGPTFQTFTAYRMKNSLFADITPQAIDDSNTVTFDTADNRPREADYSVQMKGDTAYITVACGNERKVLFLSTVPIGVEEEEPSVSGS